MSTAKADIIAQLQKDILNLQGYKPTAHNSVPDTGLGLINQAFPGGVFPLGAVHEFICTGQEDAAATGGFITGLLSPLMSNGRAALWITSQQTIFPPALKAFGIDPDKIIFVCLPNEKETLWAIEEALKCNNLAAVVGETKELDFTASRRLQLAVEKTRVTGFIIRQHPRNLNTNACLTRWKITSLASELHGDMPGVGFPRWKIDLLKVRNGKPGSWEIEWINGRFRSIHESAPVIRELHKKTG